MDSLVHVVLDRTVVAVGESVRAQVTWQHDGAPDEVRVELEWFTEGRGDTNRGVADRQVFNSAQGPIPAHMEVVLTVPHAGPVSYDGQLIRIRWRVKGIIDLRLRRDPSGEAALQVIPAVVPG